STNSAPKVPAGVDQLGAIAVDSHHDQALIHKCLEDVQRRQQALELRRLPPPYKEGAEMRGNHLLSPSPFPVEVISAMVHKKFNMPNLYLNNGIIHPSEQIQNYEMLMTLQGAPDSMKCLGFPTPLEEPVRAWFNTLAPASIASFSQLGGYFRAHFVSAKKPE